MLSRSKATLWGLALGILAGFINASLPLKFTYDAAFFGQLAGALVLVGAAHEGVHGLAAALLGHRPVFGFKPPFLYTTFKQRLPRNHLIAVALAPLALLDAVALGLWALGVAPLFMDFCLIINTIGAIGDVWIVTRLLRHGREVWVQDTMDGIEVCAEP